MTQREKFEKWANSECDHWQFVKDNLTGDLMRDTWQAATASMQAENQRLREALELLLRSVQDKDFGILQRIHAESLAESTLNETKQITEG